MTPLEFLSTVWPSEGLYCIAIPRGKAFHHEVFETIQDAVDYVDKINTIHNVFFATHSLKARRIWNERHHQDKTTKKWVGGQSIRLQENMLFGKVLFFDLDVGPNVPNKPEKYPTWQDAFADLKKFVKATSLPRPMVVLSGNGIHVYWMFEEDLGSHDTWLTQATRLKQLATHYKIKYDPSRTTDMSSVLRVVGTFNLKKGQVPVKVLAEGVVTPLADFDALLRGAIDDVDLVPSKAKVVAEDDGLGSNTVLEANLPAPDIRALFKACPQMRRLGYLKGNNSYGEWFWGDIGVVKFTENGIANVHKISSGYPNYTYAETESKIDQWDKPPTTCQKLEEVSGANNAHLCQGCKYYKQNSTPIKVARLEDSAPAPVVKLNLSSVEIDDTTEIPNPPDNYKRLDGKILMKRMKGKEEFFAQIYPYDLYPIMRNTNSERETEQHSWRVHLPHIPIKEFTIEAATFVDARALETRLANLGIYPPNFPELRGYMSAYIQELQKHNPITVQYNQLGWVEDYTKFVLPSKIFSSSGKAEPVSLGKTAASSKNFIATKGTLEKQVELLHFFDDPRYVVSQFFILSSLGSVIFHATGHNGVIIHATGDTSSGKSTAIEVAGSLFGPPKQYVLNCTEDGATPLYRNNRREVLNNLPLCLDEITHIADEVAKNFAMNATQSQRRGRLDNTGAPRDEAPSERASITLSTGNRSLQAILAVDNSAGSASAVRVFEISFRQMGIHQGHEAETMLRGLRQNYGHVGEQFIRFVVENQEEITRRVPEVMKRFGLSANMSDEERFWRAGIACTLLAGAFAKRLGLISWSLKPIEDWLRLEQLPFSRGTIADEVNDRSALATLTSYIEHIHGDMIKTTNPHNGPIPNVPHAPRGEMLGHYDIDAKVIYVLKDGFRRWCNRQGLFSPTLLRELHIRGIVPMTSIMRVLGRGTQHAKGKSPVFIVRMDHPEISETTLKVITPAVSASKASP